MQFRNTVSRWFEMYPTRTFVLFATALVLLTYGSVLGAPFVYDDLAQVVNNPNLQPWSNFAHRFLAQPVALSTSYLGYGGSAYRPVFWLAIYLDHSLWGLNATAFHATNLLLHLLNGILLFLLFRKTKIPATVAAAIGLIWLSLPVNTEVVAWVSARAYELCTLFTLGCLLASLQYLQTKRTYWLLVSFLSILAADLSHELGVVALPLLLLVLWTMRPAVSLRLWLLPAAGILLASFASAGVREAVGVKSFTTFASVKWSLLAFSQYLHLSLLPVHMSVERSTSLSLQQSHIWSYVGLCFVAAGFAYAAIRRRENPSILEGLCWYLIVILPFCFVMTYQGIAERFVYMAGIGLVAALVAGVFGIRHPAVKQVLTLCLIGWSLWNIGRTYLRARNWTDPVQLYRTSLEGTPKSALLHFNLGFTLRERGQMQESLQEYRRALELDPRYPNGYASIGDVYLGMNAYRDAIEAYQKALTQKNNDTSVLLNLGSAYQGMGANEEAEAAWQKLLHVDPKSSAAHTDLGVLYLSEQRTNDAMHQFAMAIDLKTTDIVPYYNLGALFQQAGRGDLAMVLYKKVLELKPDDADTLRNMQLLQQGH